MEVDKVLFGCCVVRFYVLESYDVCGFVFEIDWFFFGVDGVFGCVVWLESMVYGVLWVFEIGVK